MGFLETLIGKPHFDYKTYTEKFNIVVEAIDEIAFLSNTLDYRRLIDFFKEVVETFDYYKNIDENDDNSEGFSIMDNKEQLISNIINCDEYNNLINFMETYRTTIIRKCDNLKDKIIELNDIKSQADSESEDNNNLYIAKDYAGNVKLILFKLQGIKDKLQNNIEKQVPMIEENKLKFDIKIITKNDIICVLSLYRSLKNLVYKQMHVIDKEYYTATKEDVLAFRKELYRLYEMICEYFNNNRNTYVEDIHTKFQELYKYVDGLEDGDGKADANADAKADANAEDVANAAEVVANADEVVANADADAVDTKASNEERDLKKLEENMKNKEGELDNREQRVQENKELLAKATGKQRTQSSEEQLAPVAPAPPREELLRRELSSRGQPALSREEQLEARKEQALPQLREPPAQLRREFGVESILPSIPFAEKGKEAEARVKGATDAVAGAQAEAEAKFKEVADTATQLKKQTEAQFKGVADNFPSFKSLAKGATAKGETASPFSMFAQSVLNAK
jgi:hypothetical protein